MRLASRLESIALEDAQDGDRSPLGELWSDGPAVVIFIRHFG
ncbi:MAG: hypothetical protein NXI30_13190 [bacterium]|nr:hypothetical protein [bacterium]